MDLQDGYTSRFTDREATATSAIWREVTAYLQPFVPADARVIDIACDRGDFIRHVRAAERWATDLGPVGPALPEDVRFVQADGLRLDAKLPARHFDVAFMATTWNPTVACWSCNPITGWWGPPTGISSTIGWR
jgi:hypothetical protein